MPDVRTETVREHLRNALEGFDLLDESSNGRMPLGAIRQRIEKALALVEQLQREAALHPFSFARHVAAVL